MEHRQVKTERERERERERETETERQRERGIHGTPTGKDSHREGDVHGNGLSPTETVKK